MKQSKQAKTTKSPFDVTEYIHERNKSIAQIKLKNMNAAYYEKLQTLMYSIEPNSKYDTHKIAEDKRAVFIEYVKVFIDDGNWDYEFSNDWRYIKRLKQN